MYFLWGMMGLWIYFLWKFRMSFSLGLWNVSSKLTSNICWVLLAITQILCTAFCVPCHLTFMRTIWSSCHLFFLHYRGSLHRVERFVTLGSPRVRIQIQNLTLLTSTLKNERNNEEACRCMKNWRRRAATDKAVIQNTYYYPFSPHHVSDKSLKLSNTIRLGTKAQRRKIIWLKLPKGYWERWLTLKHSA